MAFITVAGENRIAYQQGHGAALNINRMVLANVPGLGAEPANRIEAIPTAHIVYDHAPTRSGYLTPNAVVYSLVMDTTVGDFDFNWVGLVDSGNVLIAAAHIPTQTKRATAGDVTGNNLTRNFMVQFSGAMALTGIDIPAETWQIDFTARLEEIDDRIRRANVRAFGSALFFGDAFKVGRISGTNYTAAVGYDVAYVGGLRANIGTAQSLTLTPGTKVWLETWLEGDITGKSVQWALRTGASLTEYTDSAGTVHYVIQIALINSDGTVTDMRTTLGFQNLAEAIITEATARANADTDLQNNLNAEALLRGNADTDLQNNLNAEALLRGNVDASLGDALNAIGTIQTNSNGWYIELPGGGIIQGGFKPVPASMGSLSGPPTVAFPIAFTEGMKFGIAGDTGYDCVSACLTQHDMDPLHYAFLRVPDYFINQVTGSIDSRYPSHDFGFYWMAIGK